MFDSALVEAQTPARSLPTAAESMMLVPKAVNNPSQQFGGVAHTGGQALIKHINNGGSPFNFPSPPLK